MLGIDDTSSARVVRWVPRCGFKPSVLLQLALTHDSLASFRLEVIADLSQNALVMKPRLDFTVQLLGNVGPIHFCS